MDIIDRVKVFNNSKFLSYTESFMNEYNSVYYLYIGIHTRNTMQFEVWI